MNIDLTQDEAIAILDALRGRLDDLNDCAMCGDANAESLDSVTQYGEAMGLMFQVVDDLLDITQSTQHVGKATGKDAASGKRTYPGVLGEAACRDEVARLRTEAVMAISNLGDAADPLVGLADLMAIRTQ